MDTRRHSMIARCLGLAVLLLASPIMAQQAMGPQTQVAHTQAPISFSPSYHAYGARLYLLDTLATKDLVATVKREGAADQTFVIEVKRGAVNPALIGAVFAVITPAAIRQAGSPKARIAMYISGKQAASSRVPPEALAECQRVATQLAGMRAGEVLELKAGRGY